MREKEKSLLDELEKKKLKWEKTGESTEIFFCLGNTMKVFQNAFEYENIVPRLYSDNDASKWNMLYKGIKVTPVREICKLNNPLVIICTTNVQTINDIAQQMECMNINSISIEEYILMKNYEYAMDNLLYFNDDRSKEVYEKILLSRVTHRKVSNDLIEKNQYFSLLPFAQVNLSGEVFVDIGAYVGDTIEKYLYLKGGTFTKIYAFEPSKRNFAALCHRTKRLNKEWDIEEGDIICVNKAVGISGYALTSDGLCNCLQEISELNKVSEDDVITEVISLDDYFSNEKVSFIKADIESYEMKMLESAVNIIKRDKPRLAICIYHTMSDFIRIPQFIKSLNLNYKFAVRHHSLDISETVLYAWVEENDRCN